MEKILSWLNDFKSFFSSEVSKISNAQAELATVSEKLAGATGYIAKCEEKITALSAELEKAQAEAKEAISKLQVAENRATETLAAQGIAPGALPDASQEDAAPSESAAAQYKRLVSEGKNQEAARFFAESADEIFKSL